MEQVEESNQATQARMTPLVDVRSGDQAGQIKLRHWSKEPLKDDQMSKSNLKTMG